MKTQQIVNWDSVNELPVSAEFWQCSKCGEWFAHELDYCEDCCFELYTKELGVSYLENNKLAVEMFMSVAHANFDNSDDFLDVIKIIDIYDTQLQAFILKRSNFESELDDLLEEQEDMRQAESEGVE